MRVLIAADKFKGSLTAAEVAQHLAVGLRAAGHDVRSVPVADGGDGTVDAALRTGFERVEVTAAGPLGEPRRTYYARRGDTAVVELASVCGLALLDVLEPLRATSYGLGTVLRAALDAGARRVVVGIGGSASTDGGVGLLQALGGQARDAAGDPLRYGGGTLTELAGITPPSVDAELVVASDVDNPLYGPHGAAAVYGPQKGASLQQVALLDAGLRHLAALTDDALAATPGAGAAGGVGFGLLLLGARLASGAELLLDLVGFEQALDGVDLVITGEGSVDEQTLAGKAPAAVAAAARARGIPALAVAGRTTLRAEQLGVQAIHPLTDLEPDLARCIADAGPLLERLGKRLGADRALAT